MFYSSAILLQRSQNKEYLLITRYVTSESLKNDGFDSNPGAFFTWFKFKWIMFKRACIQNTVGPCGKYDLNSKLRQKYSLNSFQDFQRFLHSVFVSRVNGMMYLHFILLWAIIYGDQLKVHLKLLWTSWSCLDSRPLKIPLKL